MLHIRYVVGTPRDVGAKMKILHYHARRSGSVEIRGCKVREKAQILASQSLTSHDVGSEPVGGV